MQNTKLQNVPSFNITLILISNTYDSNTYSLPIFLGCFHETAYLKEGTADLRTPVMFQLKLKLQQDEPRPQLRSQSVSNINYFPILNQQQATKLLKVKFLESCGLDELCHSK